MTQAGAALNEFAIIERYFSGLGNAQPGTLLGIGDDAAVIQPLPGEQLVFSIDTLVGGVHFPEDTSPADIACKALAVNLSDLAAMAATPAWFLLSLTLPRRDPAWLERFSNGLRQTADSFAIELIGGDTCRGPLSITIQVIGTVPADTYIRRAGARPGDLILVSGELGNAALGLAWRKGEIDLPLALRARCELALNRPRPRLELLPFLRQFARAAIDISDGLQGDLGHILKAGSCGATILRELLPVNDWIRAHGAYHYALAGGDDYEICCCVAPDCSSDIEHWNRLHPDCRLTRIGEITRQGFFLDDGAKPIDLSQGGGYRHFD